MSTKTTSLSPAKTLDEVVVRIIAMEDLSRQRRRDLCSAVRKVAGLLGRSPRDVAVDIGAISRQIARFTPAMAGMTASRWKNVRSLLGAALQLTGAKVLRRRRVELLPPVWRELLDRVPDRFHRTRLCRLFSFCAAEGFDPGQVDDALADRFFLTLKQDSLVERPSQVHRDACLAWNHAAENLAGWPAQRLQVPNRRKHYALPVSAYPASFTADLDAYLDHIAGIDPFSETARQPSAPITIKDTRRRILQLAAALVLSGRTPASVTGLADLVAPEAAKTALSFLWDRNGKRKTGQLHHFAMLLVKIAKHWVKVPASHLETLRAIRRQMDPRQTGMTARNRARLRQFEDPENVRRLIGLPTKILRSLPLDHGMSHHQAVKLQSALAIAILFVAPVRIKNLAGLTLDRHLLRSRPGGVFHLVIPAHEVKNNTPLEFELPPSLDRLLEVYMTQARPTLSPHSSVYLFPAPKGGPKTAAQLAAQVKQFIARQLGLDLNVHAFRHLAAMLFLRAHPGEYETVRLLLGHKSLETTVRTYCGMEQADALRRYDGLIDRYRREEEVLHAH